MFFFFRRTRSCLRYSQYKYREKNVQLSLVTAKQWIKLDRSRPKNHSISLVLQHINTRELCHSLLSFTNIILRYECIARTILFTVWKHKCISDCALHNKNYLEYSHIYKFLFLFTNENEPIDHQLLSCDLNIQLYMSVNLCFSISEQYIGIVIEENGSLIGFVCLHEICIYSLVQFKLLIGY